MPAKGQLKKNAKPDSVRQRAYNGTAEQKKNRASRNSARRSAAAAGKVKKGDGKDVDHKNMNPKDNRASNLQVLSKGKNRAKNQWAKKKR